MLRDKRVVGGRVSAASAAPASRGHPIPPGAPRPSGGDQSCGRCAEGASRLSRGWEARWLSSPRDTGADRSRGRAGRGIGPQPSPRGSVGSGRPTRSPASGPNGPCAFVSGAFPGRRARRGLQPRAGRPGPRALASHLTEKTRQLGLDRDRHGRAAAPTYDSGSRRLRGPGPATHLESDYTGISGACMCPPRGDGRGLRSVSRGLRTAPTFLVTAERMGRGSCLSGTQVPGVCFVRRARPAVPALDRGHRSRGVSGGIGISIRGTRAAGTIFRPLNSGFKYSSCAHADQSVVELDGRSGPNTQFIWMV